MARRAVASPSETLIHSGHSARGEGYQVAAPTFALDGQDAVALLNRDVPDMGGADF